MCDLWPQLNDFLDFNDSSVDNVAEIRTERAPGARRIPTGVSPSTVCLRFPRASSRQGIGGVRALSDYHWLASSQWHPGIKARGIAEQGAADATVKWNSHSLWGIEVVKQTLLAAISCCFLVANSGCCGLLHRLAYCPLGPGTQCDTSNCSCGCCGPCGCGLMHGPMCAPTCGPAVCGPCEVVTCEPCAPMTCEPCGPAACEPCGTVACGPACGCGCAGGAVGCGYGLFGAIHRLLHPPGWCGGCGPIYWSEFHSDPPDCCDPCDRCGNFTGCGCGCGCVSCGPVVCGPEVCGPAACAPAACGPEACGPTSFDPVGYTVPAQLPPAQEYITRLKAPIDPSPNANRLAESSRSVR